MANQTSQMSKKSTQTSPRAGKKSVRAPDPMSRFWALAAGQDMSTGAQLSDVAFTLPNALTMLRLMMTPLVLTLFLADMFVAAFWVFTAAALTDAADGWIANVFDAQTRLGAFIDPMADKVLSVSAYLILGIGGFVPQWVVVIVISRDVLLVLGMLITWIAYDRIWVAPLAIGKVTTFAQLSVLWLVFFHLAYMIESAPMSAFIEYGVYIVGALTLMSMAAYFLQWFARVAILEK